MLDQRYKTNAWKRQKELQKLLTKSFLIKEYSINHKSPEKIAIKIACGRTSIYNYLRKYNIILRTASESAKISNGKKSIRSYLYQHKRYIEEEYLEKFKPIHVIAKNLKCSYKCLRKYMLEMQIPIRNKTECQLSKLNHMYGKNDKLNPNWRGGLSKLPYSFDFTEKLKEKIRERDKKICQICYMNEKEHLQKYNHKMPIHHIDYDKQNCKENNLITLCKECHTMTSFNRDYWYAYCIYIMENFYE